MTWNEVMANIERDLNVGKKVSRNIMLDFRKKYKGHKYGLKDVHFEFNDDGQIVAHVIVVTDAKKTYTL